jgi:hypothetical protein
MSGKPSTCFSIVALIFSCVKWKGKHRESTSLGAYVWSTEQVVTKQSKPWKDLLGHIPWKCYAQMCCTGVQHSLERGYFSMGKLLQ